MKLIDTYDHLHYDVVQHELVFCNNCIKMREAQNACLASNNIKQNFEVTYVWSLHAVA